MCAARSSPLPFTEEPLGRGGREIPRYPSVDQSIRVHRQKHTEHRKRNNERADNLQVNTFEDGPGWTAIFYGNYILVGTRLAGEMYEPQPASKGRREDRPSQSPVGQKLKKSCT